MIECETQQALLHPAEQECNIKQTERVYHIPATQLLLEGFSIKQESLIHFLLHATVGFSSNYNYMDRESDLILMKGKWKRQSLYSGVQTTLGASMAL